MRHHLAESLKDQYIDVEDPLKLWQELKGRYAHQKTILLPQAQYDWQHLRIQDFKSVDEYNSALFKIVAILRMCGEKVTEKDLIEKTLSTFHASNVLLQQQYRQQKFEKYSDLIACMLLAEKNDELLMMNAAMRPPGSKSLPETAKAETNKIEAQNVATGQRETAYAHRSGRGRGRRFGQKNHRGRGRDNNRPNQDRSGYQNRSGNGRGSGQNRGIQKPTRGVCNRCGMSGHWERSCRTPRHLADLYQQYGKKPEANATFQEDEDEFNHDNDDSLYETADILKGDDE